MFEGTRRAMVATAIVVCAGAGVAGGITSFAATAGQHSHAPAPPGPHFTRGLRFQDPPVVVSKSGLLRMNLVVRRGRVPIGGVQILATTYNGKYMPPTLVVHPGDRMEINLINHLDQPTNLHFHGFHVSPDTPGDNVLLHVMPGMTQHYSLVVGPRNQPGTYWYHTHAHGYSEAQLNGGLSGLIEILGMRTRLGPRFRHVTEHYFALKQLKTVGSVAPVTDAQLKGAHAEYTVNGLVQPVMTIAPGEVQLWHLADITADAFYNLAYDGGNFTVVAQDGNFVNRAWKASHLVMAPGMRYDVLVVGGSAGTPSALRILPYDQGFDKLRNTVLVRIQSTGAPHKTLIFPKKLATWPDLRAAHIAKRRTFVFSQGPKHGKFVFKINNKLFDPNRVDVRVPLGTTEEWVLKNASTEQHPFHIHVNDFQVMSINGRPSNTHNRQDTVILPVHGTVVIRIPFTDFTGEFVFHCHVLAHEDGGMMQTVVVYRPRKK